MKLEKITNGDECKITFIPETREEKLIMGTLRNHYFFGLPKNGTYPKYAGITTEEDYVTSMSFTYKTFK